jgi:flagellar hook-length control protein FliK
MDGSILTSLMGTANTSENKTKRSGPGDADAFSKAFDEANGGKASGKAGQALVDDKSDKASEKKEEKKKQAKQDQEEFLKTTGQRSSAMPPHLRKMMQINTDLLSMADKQTFRLGEFSIEAQAKLAQSQNSGQPAKAPAAAPQSAASSGKANVDKSLGQKPGARPEADSSLAKEKSKPTAKDGEEFEKISKEMPAEKGPVNLEKLLDKDARTLEQSNKAGAAQRAEHRQQIMDQIFTKIDIQNLTNKTELQLRLNPEYLGELKLNLVQSKDGLKADFMTTSRVTRDLLAEGEDELRGMAKGKGVRLGALSFKVVENLDSTGTAG